MSESSPGICEFGGFRLDSRKGLLYLAAEGRPVPLSPRAFQTLAVLIERAGKTVTKSDLMKRVWPTTVVEENSLNQCISQLRRALGEQPGEHRFIATVPGSGYRFVANISDAASERGPAPASAGTSAAQAKILPDQGTTPANSHNIRAAPGAVPSIAVLPFSNLTGDPSKDFLGDGIAEELIHTLARVPHLRVPARTSTFAYKGQSADVRRIARDLGVDAVLEGSVRAAGERIRVTVQLVAGDTGYHTWSRTFERQWADLFALQDELAREVLLALGLGGEPTREGETRDLDAYLLYLEAVYLSWHPSAENMQRILGLFQSAIARDPTFIRAIAWVAISYTTCITLGLDMADALTRAEEAAERALAADPEITDVHTVLGILCAIRGQWLESAARFHTARSLAAGTGSAGAPFRLTSLPYSPHSLEVAYLTTTVGHLNASLISMEEKFRDRSIASRTSLAAAYLSMIHTVMGHNELARHFADTAVSLGQSRTFQLLVDINVQLALRTGKAEGVESILMDYLSPALRRAGGAKAIALFCGAVRGSTNPEQARAALRRMESEAADELGPSMRKHLIVWYCMLDAPDDAHASAWRTLDHYARLGTVGTAWGFLWLPELKPFREHPRFEAFVERMGFVPYWEQYGPPDGYELRDGRIVRVG